MHGKSRWAIALLFAAVLATAVALAPAATAKPAKQYRIALVTGDNHDPFYVTMNDGAQAAAKKLGAKVTWQGPATFEAAPQITILDTVLASKPDFLLVAPTDVQALIGPLKQFGSHKVPVMTVDTDVTAKSVRLGNVTSDNRLGGKLAAQYLSRNAATVAYVGEQRGVFTTDERWKGFEAEIKKHSGIKYVGAQFGADDPNTATSIVNALIARYPSLSGIFASDTAYGQGAAVAVQNAGKAGKIKIIAFDAEPDEVTALKRGLIQALIVQKAYDMGFKAVTDAVAYLKSGKKPPALTQPSYVIATKDNIAKPDIAKYVYRVKR